MPRKKQNISCNSCHGVCAVDLLWAPRCKQHICHGRNCKRCFASFEARKPGSTSGCDDDALRNTAISHLEKRCATPCSMLQNSGGGQLGNCTALLLRNNPTLWTLQCRVHSVGLQSSQHRMHCYARKSTRMAQSELISLCKPKKSKAPWPSSLGLALLSSLLGFALQNLQSTNKSFTVRIALSHKAHPNQHLPPRSPLTPPHRRKKIFSCVVKWDAPTTKSIDMEHLVRRAKEKRLYPSCQMLYLLHPSALPFALCQQQSNQLCNSNCCQLLRFKDSNSAVVALLQESSPKKAPQS